MSISEENDDNKEVTILEDLSAPFAVVASNDQIIKLHANKYS